jgi:hypothetical protein
VLHHLPDPDAGLRALRGVIAPGGALHLMVYAPYGRAGVYLLQAYCRALGVGTTVDEIRDLAATLKALPPDHPLTPLLRTSPDFADVAGLADALTNPCDRAYAVPQLFELLRAADLAFGRWLRQAPYLPTCGAIAATPHAARLAALPPVEQYAELELFRGAMARHSVIAYPRADTTRGISFEGDAWRRYVPLRLPETVGVHERLPPGAAAVLINRSHTFTDVYLPIDTDEERSLNRIDGERSIEAIRGSSDPERTRAFFRRLWEWDQVVFDASD